MMTVTIITERTMDNAEDGLIFCHEFLTDHIMMDEMTIFLFGSDKTISVEHNAIAQMVIITAVA